jgi:DNA repair protein RecN (Recombination protein N)
MLDELRVSNAGIITEAHLEPGPGFVVVTGETGAGKTLLLGALRLLLGATARRDQVGPADDELVVEGRFVVDGTEVVARRRVGREGRSRSYLDGVMVSARTLAEAVGPCVELVAQHDAHGLSHSAGLRRLVDTVLDEEGRGVLADAEAAVGELRRCEERLALIGGDRRALERELEMLRFQAEEIAAAGFAPGDDGELRAAAQRLRNATAIVDELGRIEQALSAEGGIVDLLSSSLAAARRLAALDPGTAALHDHLDEVARAADEIGREVVDAVDGLDHEAGALDAVEERLRVLGDLERKYGATLAEVLQFGATAEARAAELTALVGDAATLAEQREKALRRVTEVSSRLRLLRSEASQRLCAAARRHLVDLGFEAPVLAAEIRDAPDGGPHHRVDLRFASDAALPAGPLARVASGGELSRLVLALRLASGAADTPVVAFDEIDAGLGGATALAMGAKLRALASGRQVVCVTHLPQVAAHAATHYVVRRDGGAGRVAHLEGAARLEELSRMLAGLPDSEKGRQHAAELLAMADS